MGRTTYFCYGYPYTYGHSLSGYIGSLLGEQRYFRYLLVDADLFKNRLCVFRLWAIRFLCFLFLISRGGGSLSLWCM